MHNWICQKIFDTYIKEKFTCYDSLIYSNKLPYSAYVDKIRLDESRLAIRLKDIPPQTVTPPAIPFEVDKVLFNFIILWIFVVIVFLIKNLMAYRLKLKSRLMSSHEEGYRDIYTLDEVPTIINAFLYSFKNKNRVLGWSVISVQSICAILVVWVNISYYDALYEKFIQFLTFFLLPFGLIAFLLLRSAVIVLKNLH